jgi:hypothetical protein
VKKGAIVAPFFFGDRFREEHSPVGGNAEVPGFGVPAFRGSVVQFRGAEATRALGVR